jgi:Uncharacterized alpha/beta hydrolase domain (DUF2235)
MSPWYMFLVGILLGVARFPWRLAGVDLRQWVNPQLPHQVNEVDDDSWIGSIRSNCAILFWALVLAISTSYLIAWYFSGRACLLSVQNASLEPQECSFWRELFALFLGVVVILLVAGARWLRVLESCPLDPPAQWPAEIPGVAVSAALRDLRTQVAPAAVRRLIVCCDGTWNWPDQSGGETNVIRLVRAIRPNIGGITQIVRYHMGVGTGNLVDRLVGGGTGIRLSANVREAYGFIVDNYRPGDEIFLFGFSRGAYTARSLAGLIARVGVLQKYEMERFIDVWEYYTERNPQGGYLDVRVPDRHRPDDIIIKCIGVWDTVGALGIPGTRFCANSYGFHSITLNPRIHYAFQALAIDERRGNFQPAIWKRNDQAPNQILEQVWFPGVHSNVGGGYPNHGLSDSALLWMLSRVSRLLVLDLEYLKRALDCDEPYGRGILVDSRSNFWKAISCPVFRPVCRVDSSEWIHESTWERAANAAPPGDPYSTIRMTNWLEDHADRMLPRSSFEKYFGKRKRRPNVRGEVRTRKLRICDYIAMPFVGKG